MSTRLRTFKDLALKEGSIVFLRLDLNVPMQDSVISDDFRITASLPTLKYLLEKKCKIIACSHLGRPKGKGFEAEFSLAPVGQKISEYLGCEVLLCPDFLNLGVDKIVSELNSPEQMILLENLRFFSGEKNGTDEFCQKLASLCEFYVNDAFGTSHRPDASMYGVPLLFPLEKRCAGFLVEKEVRFLEEAFLKPKPPVTAIFGGSKVSDKIQVLERFCNIAQHIIVGGAMAYTFLKVLGKDIGISKYEADKLDLAQKILEYASRRNVKLYFPEDHICAASFEESAESVLCPTADIPKNLMGMDIGPLTLDMYQNIINSSQTILWNGPMGVFEWDSFSLGTKGIAQTLATRSQKAGAIVVVGGGDSAAAMEKYHLKDKVTHVSTGGGASLEFLEGKELPGIKVLKTYY
jgi:phosphoglycerate kinase